MQNERKRTWFLIEKSPGDPRRKGPLLLQDWVQQVAVAANHWNTLTKEEQKNVEFYVVSATKLMGLKHAADFYLDMAKEYGLPLKVKYKGYETVSQIFEARLIAIDADGADMTFVTTKRHARRVRWICRLEQVNPEFVIVDGIPNPQERWTDPIMTVAYPIMHGLGILDWFLRRTIARRKEGKL